MGLATCYQTSARKPIANWNYRLRVTDGDEDVEPVSQPPIPRPTKPSREFIDKTAALLQSIQDSARSCPRKPSEPVDPAREDASPEFGRKSCQPKTPSNKALDSPLMLSDVKQDESSVHAVLQHSSSIADNNSDNNAVTARLSPAAPASNDVWVNSDTFGTPRKDGQFAVNNGQSGRWRCFSDAPYTSLKTWIFVPDMRSAPKGKGSRPKKRKSKPKSKTNFMSLPGELRNEVYKYLIPECRILITCNKPNKELAMAKNVWSEENVKHKRPRSRLCHLLDLNQAEQGLGITKNLLSASKQVRSDVELYLYSRTTFCFSSTRALHRFLNTASKPGLRAIRKVEILHKGYGLPELTEHQQFRDKYYERWSKVCNQIGEELLGLEHLKLEAHMRDWPCDLTSAVPNTPWRKACLQMAPRRLPKVEIKLFHHMIHRNDMVLKDLAHRLENDMMTPDGQNERDRLETEQVLNDLAAKKAAKEARAAARAAKINAPESLTITWKDVKHSKPASTKVCRKGGLGDYSKVNTSKLCTAELENFKDQYCSERHKSGLT